MNHYNGLFLAGTPNDSLMRQLAGLGGQAVRLKAFSGATSPFAALQKALGIGDSSLRLLSTAASVLGDPHSRSLIDAAGEAQLRGSGRGLA